jgi:RNA polymerase sigma-70 factor (ECF subfamily)
MTMTLLEDRKTSDLASLVRAAQAGDRAAFGELFERYERSLFAAALRRTGDHVEAQELVQEVFIQALRKIAQLREPECFAGWLRKILARLAINRVVRADRARCTESETLEAVCVERSGPDVEVLERERAGQVREGLKRLRRLDRETLVAFYVDGRSLAEMAVDFASPVGTIKRRLHVARKRLAEELGQLAGA